MYQGARNARRSEGLRGKAFRLAAAALSIGLFSACGSDDKVELEVYSWWSRPSEGEAFDQVRLLHQASHPHVIVDNQVDPEATDQRERMASYVLSRSPPATFTANIGADLLRWATIDRSGPLSDHSYVKDVSGLLARTGLLAALPVELREELSVGSSPELYGVPINIHRLNVLYYNVTEIDRLAEERPGVDFLSFDTLCPASGAPDLPASLKIAIGPEDFALILLTFESVLPAIAGPAFYDALFKGESPESVTVPGESYLTDVRRALACVHGLSGHFIRPSEPTWWGMLEAVGSDPPRATFTVMGDWANGELSTELQQGTVQAIPVPGSEKTFVFTSDTFPLPIGADFEPEVVALLETIASPPAQRIFSSIKGSIPARRDAREAGTLTPFAAGSGDAFEDETVEKVLATSGRFPPYYRQRDLGEALRRLTAKGAPVEAIDEALIEFDSQVQLFRKFQDRLGAGSSPPRP
jgi:glucose/mannose transport system substrate-binding protein